MLQLEDYFVELAKIDPEYDVILLYDRGFMDKFAYMPAEVAQKYIENTNIKVEEVRDSRYDMVIHLVTAADGLEHCYANSINKVRIEGLQEAIERDNRIKEAWSGHVNY